MGGGVKGGEYTRTPWKVTGDHSYGPLGGAAEEAEGISEDRSENVQGPQWGCEVPCKCEHQGSDLKTRDCWGQGLLVSRQTQTLQNYSRARGRLSSRRWCPVPGGSSHCESRWTKSRAPLPAPLRACLRWLPLPEQALQWSLLSADQTGLGSVPFLPRSRLFVCAQLLFCCLPVNRKMLEFYKLMNSINFQLLAGVLGWFHISLLAAFVLKVAVLNHKNSPHNRTIHMTGFIERCLYLSQLLTINALSQSGL